MTLVWFDDKSWDAAIEAFKEQRGRKILSMEFGEVGPKRAILGFVNGNAVVACLWGTEVDVGEFDVEVAKPFWSQGLGSTLVREYIARYTPCVRQFQADAVNEKSLAMLMAAGFQPPNPNTPRFVVLSTTTVRSDR